ncbi:helix-turn-helix transcriptional regulator [Fuscibacter oryzae]|uniref:Helix-turn-helix domain-containing protein n=1 Tax=Fuscibacter oryzae TaxID=2803939 RepID=A0A8J7MSV0_9RHOB|nr:helix-turn-helix domain-containing protein [Fuscibacter oryzae]MBL4927788.1 helix-turn-helix domain-containing protein [Fuscibacter oryzae]
MATPANPNTLYLSVDQVAERLGVSTDSIWRWKRAGAFPLAVKVGPGCTRWRLSDIEAYESNLQACFTFDASHLLAA